MDLTNTAMLINIACPKRKPLPNEVTNKCSTTLLTRAQTNTIIISNVAVFYCNV